MAGMNGKKLGLAALSALALAWGGAALAADSAPGYGGHGAKRAEKLKKFDTNGDGQLDEAERQAAREQMKARGEAHHQEVLKKFDANGDGQLDEAERTKMHEERSASRFKELDTNADGVLSLSEFQAARGAGHHGRR